MRCQRHILTICKGILVYRIKVISFISCKKLKISNKLIFKISYRLGCNSFLQNRGCIKINVNNTNKSVNKATNATLFLKKVRLNTKKNALGNKIVSFIPQRI